MSIQSAGAKAPFEKPQLKYAHNAFGRIEPSMCCLEAEVTTT